MKRWHIMMVLTLSFVAAPGLLLAPVAQAGIGGSPGGGTSCFATKTAPNKQSLKLTGTMTMVATSGVGTSGDNDVDVIVRMQEKSGAPRFFRLHLLTPISNLTNAARVCLVFDPTSFAPGSANEAAVNAFLNEVRSAYQVGAALFQLLCTRTDAAGTCVDTSQAVYADELELSAGQTVIPGTSPLNAGSVGDFTVYAVF